MTTDISLTSLDIAEMMEYEHDDVIRVIRTLAISGLIQSPQIRGAGKTNNFWRGHDINIYVFFGEIGKRDSVVLAAHLSPEFMARLLERWRELETKAKDPESTDRTTECASILHRNQTMNSNISLRDYFAAAALQSLLSDSNLNWEFSEYSKCAYEYADDMLITRNEPKNSRIKREPNHEQ